MVTATSPSERFARDAVIAVLTGYLTATIVGGVGSRVVTRILAMINGDQAGVMTEAGNIAGKITPGGNHFFDVFRERACTDTGWSPVPRRATLAAGF